MTLYEIWLLERYSNIIFTLPSQSFALAIVQFLYQLRRYNSTILCNRESLELVKHWLLLYIKSTTAPALTKRLTL